MRRKPKPYSVYVLQYKSSYSPTSSDLERNPNRHTGRPIVSVHTTGKPVEGEIAKKKAKNVKIRRARQEPVLNKRFTSKQGVLRAKDQLIAELRDRGWTVLNRSAPRSYRVYCLELSLQARPNTAKNDGFEVDADRPVVYVGQTGKTVAERIADHRAGRFSSSWVQRYFVRERNDLVERYGEDGLLTERESLQWERKLTRKLRSLGFGVRGGC